MNKVLEEGITKYNEEDIMNDQDIHEIIIRAIYGELKKEGHKIVNVIDDVRMLPNIFVEEGNKAYGIVVKSSVYPNYKKISYRNQKKLIDYCNNYNLIPVYIGGSIQSIDKKRAAASLAHKDDGFNISTTGLKKIPTMFEIGSIEYLSNKLYLVGKYIKEKNERKLLELFDNNCLFEDVIGDNKYIGHSNIKKCLLDRFNKYNENNIDIDEDIVEFVGYNVDIKQSFGYKYISTDDKDTYIRVPRSELGLLLEEIDGNNVKSIIFTISLNNSGKIDNIEEDTPNRYNFETYFEEYEDLKL